MFTCEGLTGDTQPDNVMISSWAYFDTEIAGALSLRIVRDQGLKIKSYVKLNIAIF